MAKWKPTHPRISVILAPQARCGIVIRRGPSKQVCTIGWRLKSDAFQLGQWFKGRIYPDRCDLSPTGEFFIYFAMNGKWHTETKGSWSAISRAPYLKAVALWPKGDCWGGGGLFVDQSHYWLSMTDHDDCLITPPHVLKRANKFPTYGFAGGTFQDPYIRRLIRDGWQFLTHCDARGRNVMMFEKTFGKHWLLQKFLKGNGDHPQLGRYHLEWHRLVGTKGQPTIDGFDWEWADVDGKRLVWARAGCLFAGMPDKSGLVEIQQLADFNSMKFEPIEAPY